MTTVVRKFILREFELYSDFHRNQINRIIHCVFVPMIHLTVSLMLASYASTFAVFCSGVTLFVFYMCLDAEAGLLLLPYLVSIYMLACVITHRVARENILPFAGFLNVCSWLAQFVGHAIFEQRAPAVSESFFGSLITAPLFVVLEVLYGLGIGSGLKARLDEQQRIGTRGRPADMRGEHVAEGETKASRVKEIANDIHKRL